MIASKLLALLFSVAILVNAYAVRRIVGTWLFPAVIFALFWFAFTFLPLAILISAPVNPWAVLYILAGCVAVSMSSLVGFRWRDAFRLNARKPAAAEYLNTPVLRWVFAIAALGALPCFALNMMTQGFTLGDLTSRMFETATTYAVMRYTDSLTPNIYARLNIILAYLAATTGGLLYGSARSKRQAVLTFVGAFLPALLQMLFESGKGLLFFFIVLFFAGVLVTRVFDGRFALFDRATRRRALWFLSVLVPLTFVSFLARGLYAIEDTRELNAALRRYAATYAFGHLYAFSDWFSWRTGFDASLSYVAEPAGYGFYTFTSLFRLAGSSRVLPIGIYDDFYEYGNLLFTNIFSIYRGVVMDFGIAGGLIFMFAIGWVMHLVFYRLVREPRPTVSIALFIYTIGFCYMSFAVSMWTWNIMPPVALMLCAVLTLNRLTGAGASTAVPRRARLIGVLPSRPEI